MLNLLVQATGHPQRLHRFGLTVDGRTDEVQEALVAELGAAFLTASLGLPDRQPSRHDVAPWVSFLHDDPWRLFRAAEAARKAMVWLSARRPAMTTVEMWQKMATLILETHYGFPLDDTTLGCRSVVERHLECGITPLMAINALARIYQWERCDQPQRSLFLNDVGADSEILTLSEMCPGLLTCYRVPASTGVPEEAERADSFPLLPTPVASEGEGAANDDGPDDPDDNVVALPWAARRGKNNPHIQRFVSLFNQTAPDANRWQVFSDFVHMAACSLYNAIHRDETFEADYRQRVARYSTEDAHNMSRLLAEVIEGLEFCPTDFLGQIFMNLELGNTRHGQYFTPYNVCYTMSRMTLSDRLSVLTSGERDFITVSDPACGAGGMIVAMAEAMLEAGFNPQKQMMVYCVDIDPVSLDVTEEDITWQLRGSHSDYVNTRILFTREKLMAVMEAMLSGLDSDEATLARCRQVLTLWIAGLDTLSKEEEQPDWLPRVHPHSSGQCDLLLKGNPAALTEADEETYLRVTGQQDLPVHRRIPQATFSKTVRYWHRFETWLAEQLQDITQHCYRKLCRFVANATTEPRLLHEYRGEYGSLRLFVGPQNIDEIDILEFNPEYIVSWVDKVADGVTAIPHGVIVPVELRLQPLVKAIAGSSKNLRLSHSGYRGFTGCHDAHTDSF